MEKPQRRGEGRDPAGFPVAGGVDALLQRFPLGVPPGAERAGVSRLAAG
jgi:hypothetical protein